MLYYHFHCVHTCGVSVKERGTKCLPAMDTRLTSTALPADLTENIRYHQARKISVTNLKLHHRQTETKAVCVVEDVQESHSLRTEATSAVTSACLRLVQYSLSSEQTPHLCSYFPLRLLWWLVSIVWLVLFVSVIRPFSRPSPARWETRAVVVSRIFVQILWGFVEVLGAFVEVWICLLKVLCICVYFVGVCVCHCGDFCVFVEVFSEFVEVCWGFVCHCEDFDSPCGYFVCQCGGFLCHCGGFLCHCGIFFMNLWSFV